MSDRFAELDDRLEALKKVADLVGDRLPRVRDEELALQVARALDKLLVHLARGRGAIDVSIGEKLTDLKVGVRAMHLGYSNIHDYAREELGINASTAAKIERLARKLKDRPLLREAVRSGEITPRKAEVIAPVAVGEAEALWVLRTPDETVRSLKVLVARPPDPADAEEQWLRLRACVPPEQRPVLDEAMALAGRLLGPGASKMQRLEAMAQEYLASHPAPDDDPVDDVLFPGEQPESLEKWLEEQNRKWADLGSVALLRAPEVSEETSPWKIDRELKRLVRKREAWDDVLGRIAMEFKRLRCWAELDFGSFAHYCEERLGMAERTISQRASLERSLNRLPSLREALRQKRITYEKARLIARSGDLAAIGELVAKAEKMTCLDLRRELEEQEEAQMCARGEFTAWLAAPVVEVLKAACRAAEAAAGQGLSPGECLVAIAEHCAATWRPQLKERITLSRRILARDRYRCMVRGCSRAATHTHHVRFRSQGGNDEEWNLVAVCAAHHLIGIHEELIRVTGRAPDALVWEFGLRRPREEADPLYPADGTA